ncbi:MAG: hypothetical protein JRN46_01620 [Nitrososphaerota archaeon]|nr:hypothetical protein [Nitrososphaerota archaeon]
MLAYLFLSLPAVLLEVVFSTSIASSEGVAALGRLLGPFSEVLVLVLTILPWALAAVSVYAVLSFRSSLVLTLLVVDYFVLSLVQGSAAAPGLLSLSPEASAGAVVGSTFLALMAFSFSRAARIRGANPPVIRTRGSSLFKALGLSLDFAVPAVLAAVLVTATVETFGAVKGALESLPPPLSEIFSSSITSPIAAVGLTLLVAGILMWLVKELVEPWVMYYSITKEDAVKLLREDLKKVSEQAESVNRRNYRGTALTVAVVGSIVAFLVVYFGPGAVVREAPSLFGGHQPTSYGQFVARANALYDQVQDDIVSIARLLWG